MNTREFTYADPTVDRLRSFFRDNPIWQKAAEVIDQKSTSRVTFRHRPGEEWRLLRRRERTVLEPGLAADPDFAFHFSEGAVDRITAVEGDIADFAIELFSAALDTNEETSLGLEVIAPFGRLFRRGYVRLLWAGGGALLAFGARNGIRSIGELRDLVAHLRDPMTNRPS